MEVNESKLNELLAESWSAISAPPLVPRWW